MESADVLPVRRDDGADAGVCPGVSAKVVDGSVIAHRGQDLLMLRANTQRSFILVKYSARVLPTLRKLWII